MSFRAYDGQEVEQIWIWADYVRLIFDIGDAPEPALYIDVTDFEFTDADGTLTDDLRKCVRFVDCGAGDGLSRWGLVKLRSTVPAWAPTRSWPVPIRFIQDDTRCVVGV